MFVIRSLAPSNDLTHMRSGVTPKAKAIRCQPRADKQEIQDNTKNTVFNSCHRPLSVVIFTNIFANFFV